MGFKDTFQKETRMSIGDLAEEIRRTVPMEDVLNYYCPAQMNRKQNKRIPCPLHNGEDRNFSYSFFAFKCFVCGEGGDTISFVQKYLNLPDRKSAMERLNSDLNLGLPMSGTVSGDLSNEIIRRRRESEDRQRKKEEDEKRYNDLMDKFVWAERTKRTAEPFSDEWCKAVKEYDLYSYLLETEETKSYRERSNSI